jgi:hypothetical protein
MELAFKAHEVYRCKEEIAELREKSSGETITHKQCVKDLNFDIDRLTALLALKNQKLDSKTSELSNLTRGFDQKVEELERSRMSITRVFTFLGLFLIIVKSYYPLDPIIHWILLSIRFYFILDCIIRWILLSIES